MSSSSVGKLLVCWVIALFSGWLFSTVAAMAASGGRELPAPTGRFPVGRVTYFWTDDSRPEPRTKDEGDHRELRVDVWYPAEPPERAAKADYFPDLRTLGKQLGPEVMLLGAIKGHALAAPPIAPGTHRYPVVVFSPGYGTNANQYAGFVEELVSHGYLVATVDHPFQSRAIVYPDGRIVTVSSPEPSTSADPQARELDYRAQMEVLAADLRFVLDQLPRLNAREMPSQFAGRLDLERVAVAGHSIGGSAATKAALTDSRFKAAVNLDGHHQGLPMIQDAKGQVFRQPFIELTDGNSPPTDKQLAAWKLSRPEYEAEMAANTKRVDELMNRVDGGSFRVTAPGIRHNSFGDMAIWDLDSLETRYRRIQLVRDYARAFLDKTLRNDQHTLLDNGATPYAEVKVERFGPAR